MTTTLEYALLAGDAYFSTRSEANRFPIPEGWTEDTDERRVDVQTGFEARTFLKGDEIVISFAGTDPNNSGLLTSPDGRTNSALANGKWSDQLLQAAKYYLDIKAANPGAVITFTGHSLGGGLAALMAVFFDVQAQTFDQAPFSKSALDIENNNAQDLRNRLAALGAPYSTSLAKLDTYIQLRDASTLNGYIPRQERVDTVRVQGEFLDGGLAGNNPFGNPQTVIPHGPADWALASFDLHSQALLTAFLQSEKAALPKANPDHTLSEVSKKLTPLLKMLFDKNLYAFDAAKADPNFLDLIVRHEAGVNAGDNADVAITADAMVTRFTKDLWKLAQDGGLTVNDGNSSNAALAEVSQALITFAMQMYYEDTANSKDKTKELFTAITGGVSLKRTDVSANWSDVKGKTYFESYLAQSSNGLSQAERDIITAQLPDLNQWFVQAGSGGMNATAGTERAFMLGGKGNDTLTGGSAADLLVGNQGSDRLIGGKGNDILMGGSGVDFYFESTGDGADKIIDSDAKGKLFLDDAGKTTAAKMFIGVTGQPNTWISADGKMTLSHAGGWLLSFEGGSVDLGSTLNQGDLGLHWREGFVLPATTNDIWGDLTLADVQPNQEGDQWAQDELGNYYTNTTAAPNRVDTLFDSAGNDHISSGGGNDVISTARGGKNFVEAGAGRDWVHGGGGVDIIAGGADGDILEGGAGNDWVFADEVISLQQAIINGNTLTGGVGKGDWLNGNAGDDVLIGGRNDDVIFGGGGSDIIVGGAGNDLIGGDIDWNSKSLSWTFVNGVVGPIEGTENPTDYGDDEIYAGSGDDRVFGGQGNDTLYGEGDNDVLVGGGDSDILFGGAGNDWLLGDFSEDSGLDGDDYLDGGEGADLLFGGGGNDYLVVRQGDQAEGGTGNDFYDIRGNGDVKDISGQNHYLIDATKATSIKLSDLGRLGSKIEVVNSSGTALTPTLSVSTNGEQYLQLGALTISGQGWMDGSLSDISVGGSVYSARQLLQSTNSQINVDITRTNFEVFTGSGADNIGILGTGNTVYAGRGNDNIFIQAADTTVHYNAGDGHDKVTLYSGAFEELATPLKLVLGDGINLEEVRLGRSGGNMVILYLPGAGNETFTIDTLGVDVEGVLDRIIVTAGDQTGTLSSILLNGQEFQGNAQDNFMFSFRKPTTLTGQGGNDHLEGSNFDDVLDGGAGNDLLRGGLGDDTYRWGRGFGHDVVEDTGGVDALKLMNLNESDVIVRQSNSINAKSLVITVKGSDETLTIPHYFDSEYPEVLIEKIIFADGNQWDAAEVQVRSLLGSDGDDLIFGTAGADVLTGGLGNDGLDGGDGDDILDGGEGDDFLSGGNGNDRLIGGPGNDTLSGDGGNDTYVWGLGGGNDTIYDWGGEADRLQLEGLRPEDVAGVRIDNGNAVLTIKSTGETLSIVQNFYGLESYYYTIEQFEFADGTIWDIADQSLHFAKMASYDSQQYIGGWDLPDWIVGGGNGNILEGFGGDDLLEGQGGNDEIYGGSGDDTLVGGQGSDTYYFESGGGHDIILSTDSGANSDTLVFQGDIDQSDVRFSRFGDDLVLTISDGVDSVVVKQWFDTATYSKLESIVFSNGDVLYTQDVDALFIDSHVNSAPVQQTAIADKSAEQGTTFVYTVPADVFVDPDAGDILQYSATLSDGASLPSWIAFDSGTRTFSGTPGINDLGSLQFNVIATDNYGASSVASFDLTVIEVVDDPLAGDNTLYADSNNTPVYGGAGDDILYGSWARSTLYGGTGNDTLIAQGGPNNILDGGEGDDVLVGGWGQDTLIGGEGNNTITAMGGDALITAGAGNDVINSNYGNDIINAGDGNNLINAGGGNNQVTAGSGNDVITTDWGNDTVMAGAGNDTISTGWGADTIDAGAGDDIIDAGGGGDTIRGGLGNDQITNTQWSDDRYLFAAGDGQDSVLDAGGHDTLIVENIHSDQLWFSHIGNDLNIIVMGTSDSITVKDWYVGGQYPGAQYHLDQIQTSDGKTLLDGQVQNLVDAMAAFSPPAAGQTSLTDAMATTLTPVIAANWH